MRLSTLRAIHIRGGKADEIFTPDREVTPWAEPPSARSDCGSQLPPQHRLLIMTGKSNKRTETHASPDELRLSDVLTRAVK